MQTRLSSIVVPIYKMIPFFVFADLIYWLIQDFRNIVTPGFIFLLFFGLIWYFVTFRWKRVSLNGDRLNVSNYLKTVEIPLSEIEIVEASSFWGLQPQTIKVTFKTPSAFGNDIAYVPRPLGLYAKPPAEELQRIMLDSQK